jgi:glycoprotein endo-alpha-1,2-mannosidase
MKALRLSLIGALFILLASCRTEIAPAVVPPPDDQPGVTPGLPPAKTNAMTLWMHYMPWFEGEYSLGAGNWGWHWKMNTMDPNVIVDAATGKRQIASHYYPLIGPYSSSDPAVVEYHALLMKYAGIDGILIDWYGSQNINDFGTNLRNSNVLIKILKAAGLKFGVVYEDWTCGSSSTPASIAKARADMDYLESSYFIKSGYLRLGGQNLFLVFGPRTFNTASDWSSILQGHASTLLVPLVGRMGGVGAKSEFMWPGSSSFKSDVDGFNTSRAKLLAYPIASAFPGFNDFYIEGGAGAGYFKIDPYDGTTDPAATLSYTLNSAKDAKLDYVQIATWNDFGEGTMIEPTREFQFAFLERIQQFSGVSYGAGELQAAYRLYKARKQYAGNATAEAKLDECFSDLCQLKVAEAEQILTDLGA